MRSFRRFTFAVVLALALGGCGRGGSSGLDIGFENAAISKALAEHRCIEFRELNICPADESAGSSTPTPGAAPRVETDLANATSLDCFQAKPGDPCTFTLTFTPLAFPSDTTFKVLARSSAPGSPWVLGSDPVPAGGAGGAGAPSFSATLVVTSVADAEVQLAVLAFAGPQSSPTEVPQLHETAATFAFVTHPLAVNVVTPTVTPTPTGKPTNTATATSTPGAGDCCQCPSSCAAPIDGACGSCSVVFGAACFGESLCTMRTPTPTPSPSPSPAPCLRDNGDGTIADICTGLMWEKKDQAGGLHDSSDRYPWAGECSTRERPHRLCQPNAAAAAACAQATNGAAGCSQCDAGVSCVDDAVMPSGLPLTTVWSWVAQLNQGQGFAGHTDWRIPSIGKEGDPPELETILLPTCAVGSACVAPVFDTNCEPGALCGPSLPCGPQQVCVQRPDVANQTCKATPGCTVTSCSCTWGWPHWSATSDVSTPDTRSAWTLEFASGIFVNSNKRSLWSVRAVRGRTTPTPTPTPGANDCCQCASSCAAPVDGSCGSCTIVVGAACDGAQLCAPPAPTLTPTPCLKDNGDGTVTDGCRGFMWEKKDRAGGLHDYAALYTWAGACTAESALCQPNAEAAATCAQQTGGAEGCDQCVSGTCVVDPNHNGASTTIWDWVNQLNASTFAGYNDWQIPTVGYDGDMAQLETILMQTTPPCAGPTVPLAFNRDCTSGCTVASCSCTATLPDYWSATTFTSLQGLANGVNFSFCPASTGAGPKTNANSIRAVRSGL